MLVKNKRIKKNKKKNRKKKIRENDYCIENINEAIKAIREKNLTLRDASDQFNIPKSTLHDKLSGKSSIESKKGPECYLTDAVEKKIVDWVIESGELGFPVTMKRLRDTVQKFMKKKEKENKCAKKAEEKALREEVNEETSNCDKKKKVIPFKDCRPGVTWCNLFLKRHPELSRRIPQNLTTTRSAVSEKKVRQWFEYVKEYLAKNNMTELAPENIYNLDESAFKLVPKADKVLVKRGARAVYQIVSAKEKATITVLFTGNAAGELAPPLIMFEQKKALRENTIKHIPEGWGAGYTESGWMTGDSFFSFIKNIFHPWLIKKDSTFPVLLYVDNHASHVNEELLTFCKENQIQLMALYPNSTHLIQPLDVAFFHPLKEHYKQAVIDYKVENNIIDIKKVMVAEIIQKAIENMDFKKGIISGFRASGLFPFNPDAVNYNLLKKTNKKLNNSNADCEEEPCTVVTTPLNDNKHRESLAYFETDILSSSIVELFKEKESEESWSGQSEYKELFLAWKKMKKLASNL